jgi:hypothetical protein
VKRPDAGPRRRPAIASLELVLALPLLVFLAAMILAIGRVGVARTGAQLQARRDAWKRPVSNGAAERAPLPGPPDGHDVIREGGARGLSVGAVDRPVTLAPMLPTSIPLGARLSVLLDPLDHVTAPFPFHGRFTPDGRVVRLKAGVFPGLGGITGGLAEHAADAAAKKSELDSGMEDMRKQGDVLKERKEKIVEEMRKVVMDRKLSKKEKEEKLKKLKEELEKIKKSEADMKKAETQYGGL